MELEQDYVELTVECEQFYVGMECHGTFRNISNMETDYDEIIQLILNPASINLTLYVPCIMFQCVDKPTRCNTSYE